MKRDGPQVMDDGQQLPLAEGSAHCPKHDRTMLQSYGNHHRVAQKKIIPRYDIQATVVSAEWHKKYKYHGTKVHKEWHEITRNECINLAWTGLRRQRSSLGS